MQKLEYRRGTIHFAELETGGKRVECPTCHAPFKPHLGNLIAARFQCKSCKANITFRSTSGRTVTCPCCSFSRPMPSLGTLVCGGCSATVIYRKDDRAVKCFQCKHITISHEATYYETTQVNRVVPPQVNRVVPPQVNRVFHPEVNRIVPPQVNRIVHPQVNWIVHPQVNRVVPPQVNRIVPPQVNRVIPPQVNRVVPPQVNGIVPPQINRVIPPRVNRMNRRATAETESTASSSAVIPKPESSHTNVDEYPDSDPHDQFMRNLILGIFKRKAEEDKTEAKSKKIRL